MVYLTRHTIYISSMGKVHKKDQDSTQYFINASFFFFFSVSMRVNGGMSLRNGMWHGLRNGIIMLTLIYQNDLKK